MGWFVKKIEFVAAVIEFEGKLLAFQRGPAKYDYVSKKYEFPGSKAKIFTKTLCCWDA